MELHRQRALLFFKAGRLLPALQLYAQTRLGREEHRSAEDLFRQAAADAWHSLLLDPIADQDSQLCDIVPEAAEYLGCEPEDLRPDLIEIELTEGRRCTRSADLWRNFLLPADFPATRVCDLNICLVGEETIERKKEAWGLHGLTEDMPLLRIVVTAAVARKARNKKNKITFDGIKELCEKVLEMHLE